MNTDEHTELGNMLRFSAWGDVLVNNPYINFNGQGVLSIQLQAFGQNGFPQPLALTLSAGEMIGMSGDFFGGKEVDLKLPTVGEFNTQKFGEEDALENEFLGRELIRQPITDLEAAKFLCSYKKLANKDTKRSEIDTIYKILKANYIPFSSVLNSYAQELAYLFKVKNYGEILTRDFTHFTPWSIRAYVIGHRLALRYAKLTFELGQYLANVQSGQSYESNNPDFIAITSQLSLLTKEALQKLVYGYQALALSMELFCFHYYTDHFAAGHGAFMGDLRIQLPKKFGTWGSILVNNLHNELNSVTVNTHRPYHSNASNNDPVIQAGGDGDFNLPNNAQNKKACVEGMSESLNDILQVFKGKPLPSQKAFGGLAKLPDVDVLYRQHSPLILLGPNNRMYYRTNIKEIKVLAPSELRAIYREPLKNGYSEITNKWSAFVLVFKLRVLSHWYQASVVQPSPEQLKLIEQEEEMLHPERRLKLLTPLAIEKKEPSPAWRNLVAPVRQEANRHSLFKEPSNIAGSDQIQPQEPCTPQAMPACF